MLQGKATKKEKEAINIGTALLEADWEGNDEFSKGMRFMKKLLRNRRG